MNPTNPTIRALIPVHLYGQMAEMGEILAIADDHGLKVIEDAAQAIGAEYRGALSPNEPNEPYEPNEPVSSSRAGSLADCGCFSFYPTKNLGAYGDAGMITTHNDELAGTLRMLRVHGADPKYYHQKVGFNSRLDAIQAAILAVKLKHLDRWSISRAQVADRYDALLRDVEGIVTPYRAADRSHIFHQYTIRVLDGKRDALREHLRERGIGTMIYYPRPLHLQACFADLGYREGELPESERASREALSLPIFPELLPEEIETVAHEIRAFVER